MGVEYDHPIAVPRAARTRTGFADHRDGAAADRYPLQFAVGKECDLVTCRRKKRVARAAGTVERLRTWSIELSDPQLAFAIRIGRDERQRPAVG